MLPKFHSYLNLLAGIAQLDCGRGRPLAGGIRQGNFEETVWSRLDEDDSE